MFTCKVIFDIIINNTIINTFIKIKNKYFTFMYY